MAQITVGPPLPEDKAAWAALFEGYRRFYKMPAEKLFTPDHAVAQMLIVIDSLTPADSGGLFAWDGQRIPY